VYVTHNNETNALEGTLMMDHKVTMTNYSSQGLNSPERFCQFKESLENLIEGQGNKENPSAFHQLILQLLANDTLQTYKTATELALEDNRSQALIDIGLAAVTDLVFPKGARQLQARYLRRITSKARKMNASDFVSRIQTLNR
jgi:hypothetical protein